MEKQPEILDGQRSAHRVFRIQIRTTSDRLRSLNPFRHIAWVATKSSDPENGCSQGLESVELQFRTVDLWLFKTDKWPVPQEPFTVLNQFQRTLLTSWINIFLVCVPIGIALSHTTNNSPATFAINYLAEVPLWFLCDYALEELEKYLNRRVSDILDIFTNNTVQLISSILLVKSGQIQLLRTSLVGGILSNILVLLGLSFVIGGLNHHTQYFNRTGAQGSSSLLSIAATSSLIPTAVNMLGQTTSENLLKQSRGVAVVLLFIYVSYTYCQMFTHREEYDDWGKSRKIINNAEGRHISGRSAARNTDSTVVITNGDTSPGQDIEQVQGHTSQSKASSPATLDPITRRAILNQPADRVANETSDTTSSKPNDTTAIHTEPRDNSPADEEIHGPQLCFAVAAALFAATIVLLFFCIDATVSSLSSLTESLSPTFVSLILLPVPNYDFAAVSLASEDYLGQAMKYTVGRSIQTALLVVPLVVLMSWGVAGDGGMSLALDGFEVVSLFTTILLLNFLVVDAKVHWVHGVLLLADWVLIAIAAYFVIN